MVKREELFIQVKLSAQQNLGINKIWLIKDLFIQAKLWNSNHRPEHVKPDIMKTLEDLQLDYIDSFVIHWPQAVPSTGVIMLNPQYFLIFSLQERSALSALMDVFPPTTARTPCSRWLTRASTARTWTATTSRPGRPWRSWWTRGSPRPSGCLTLTGVTLHGDYAIISNR